MYSAIYDVTKSYLTGVKTRKFVMALLHGKQGLLCDKYSILHSYIYRNSPLVRVVKYFAEGHLPQNEGNGKDSVPAVGL